MEPPSDPNMTLRRPIVMICLVATAATCARSDSACNKFPGGSDWAVSLKSAAGTGLEGVVTSQSKFVGQRLSPEGVSDSVSGPITELSLGGNNLHIGFGSTRIQIDGQCHGPDSVAARYVFRDETGTGTLIRKSR